MPTIDAHTCSSTIYEADKKCALLPCSGSFYSFFFEPVWVLLQKRS